MPWITDPNKAMIYGGDVKPLEPVSNTPLDPAGSFTAHLKDCRGTLELVTDAVPPHWKCFQCCKEFLYGLLTSIPEQAKCIVPCGVAARVEKIPSFIYGLFETEESISFTIFGESTLVYNKATGEIKWLK